MSDPIELIQKLEGLIEQRRDLSERLQKVQDDLEETQASYKRSVDDFEVDLYLESERTGKRLPSQALREKLARRNMTPELLGRYDGLIFMRDRLMRNLQDLKVDIDGLRSVLSAEKELGFGPSRSWPRRPSENAPDGSYGGSRSVA